jgi:hypothetical protein
MTARGRAIYEAPLAGEVLLRLLLSRHGQRICSLDALALLAAVKFVDDAGASELIDET